MSLSVKVDSHKQGCKDSMSRVNPEKEYCPNPDCRAPNKKHLKKNFRRVEWFERPVCGSCRFHIPAAEVQEVAITDNAPAHKALDQQNSSPKPDSFRSALMDVTVPTCKLPFFVSRQLWWCPVAHIFSHMPAFACSWHLSLFFRNGRLR